MQRFVKELDAASLEHNFRIVKLQAKAVDYFQILQNDYLDMRDFEKLGFSLS